MEAGGQDGHQVVSVCKDPLLSLCFWSETGDRGQRCFSQMWEQKWNHSVENDPKLLNSSRSKMARKRPRACRANGRDVGCRSESVRDGARAGAQAARSPLHGLMAHGDDQEIHQRGWGRETRLGCAGT